MSFSAISLGKRGRVTLRHFANQALPCSWHPHLGSLPLWKLRSCVGVDSLACVSMLLRWLDKAASLKASSRLEVHALCARTDQRDYLLMCFGAFPSHESYFWPAVIPFTFDMHSHPELLVVQLRN